MLFRGIQGLANTLLKIVHFELLTRSLAMSVAFKFYFPAKLIIQQHIFTYMLEIIQNM